MYVSPRPVTISLKKFFITNPLILEEQNSFKIIGTIFWNGELCHDNME
jgi:hypothetical protein